MKKIYLITIIILILASIFFIYKQKEIKPSLSSNSVSITPEQDICSNKDYNIKDEEKKNSIAKEGQNVFLENTNLSEDYFDKHFEFACGGENKYSGVDHVSRMVVFKFNIGEYSKNVSVYDLPFLKGSGKFNYKGLNEIKQVMSKAEAINKITECLGFKPNSLSLELNGVLLNEPAFSGLTLLGYSASNNMNASLNLESGECATYPSRNGS